jgi:hypothetical protein
MALPGPQLDGASKADFATVDFAGRDLATSDRTTTVAAPDLGCVNHLCGGQCDPGWADCNGNPADGCEVNVTSDAANCGTCGNACGAGRMCSGGACACATGTTSCGGACVDLMTDSTNCGACGARARRGPRAAAVPAST